MTTIRLRFTNETAYSTQLLEILVQFATPDEWKNFEQDAASFYPITFGERPHELLQSQFTGSDITINIPDPLDLPFYGNRIMQEARPAVLSDGYCPPSISFQSKNSCPWSTSPNGYWAIIAHEIHRAYLHWRNPANYNNAMEPLSLAEADQEKECERYAIRVVKKWKAEHGENDLPFAQLESMESRVADASAKIPKTGSGLR